MATTRLYTAADLYEMEDGPQGQQYYIIDGELFEDRSTPLGSMLAAHLIVRMYEYVEPLALGEFLGADGAYVLRENPDTVLIPDLSFIRAERMPPKEQQDEFPRFAPDIAVEIFSPHNRASDLSRKIAIYRDVKTPLVWLVDPFKQTVTVYAGAIEPRTLSASDTLDGGDVLPGFTLPLAQLFA